MPVVDREVDAVVVEVEEVAEEADEEAVEVDDAEVETDVLETTVLDVTEDEPPNTVTVPCMYL